MSPGRDSKGDDVDDVRGNLLLLLGGVANQLPRTPQHELLLLVVKNSVQEK